MKTLKKIFASLGSLVVLLSVAAFVSMAGGHGWGTDFMGASTGVASLVWALVQPVIWLD